MDFRTFLAYSLALGVNPAVTLKGMTSGGSKKATAKGKRHIHRPAGSKLARKALNHEIGKGQPR